MHWFLSRAAAAAALAAALAVPAAPALAQAAEWKFFTYFAPNDTPTTLHKGLAEDITKASGGRLKVTVFASGELPYKAQDVLRALATNQVQMGDLATGPVAAEAPELNVYSIPFVCSSFDGFFKSVAEAAPTVDEVLAKRFGVGGLMHWTMPPQQIWLVQPAGGIDDLKNRKIRTWNKEQVDMLRLLGGQGVAMTAAEVIPALQRKVVDGAITAAIPAMDWKFDEVAKFGYMLNFTLSHQIVGVNLEQLKKLPADLQAIVTGKTREWGAKYRKTIEEGDGSARKALVAKGMTLKDASPADLKKVRDVTRPMWDEWANKNGDVAKKLLATVSKSCA